MGSKILNARASVLITLINRHYAGGLPLSSKSVCEDTCIMLNVTPAYLDKVIDFMVDAGLATIEQRDLFLFLQLTPDAREVAAGGATPKVDRGAANG